MTRRRRPLLITIVHLSRASTTHIVLHQSSSPSIRIPYHSRSARARVIVARPRSPFCDPFYKSKVLYHQVTFLRSMGTCRLHAVYHVPSELSFLSYMYEYLLRYPWIFFFSYYSLPTLGLLLLLFSHRKRSHLGRFSGNNTRLHFGVGVLFHSSLNLCYQLRWWTQQTLCCDHMSWMRSLIKDNTSPLNCRNTSSPVQEIGPYVGEETDEDNEMNHSGR